jgi:anthraniloyl-CoA monooxygenase
VSTPLKILIVGGGPAGLYVGLLLKKADPAHRIQIVERNPKGATYGWGVVFSDRTLNAFREADPPTCEAITKAFVSWDAIDIHFKGKIMRCAGNVFAGLSRKRLLEILQDRCLELGIKIDYKSEVSDFSSFSDYDLVIAADGVNSFVRQHFAESFKPDLTLGKARYIWYGTYRSFDSFTFSIQPNQQGVFQAHAYPFDGETSTFIVECDEPSWRAAGLDKMGEAESIAYCQNLFVADLKGRALLSNNSKWVNFTLVKNRRWSHQNIVLLGDAAHTAHFSIGSGTKLAMEDAIALVKSINEYHDVPSALASYEMDRKPRVENLQASARESQDYFETLRRFTHLDPEQFAFHLLTRSGRLTYDNLKTRDAAFVHRVESWFASQAHGAETTPLLAPAPLFVPFKLRDYLLANRAVLAPSSTFTATEGTPDSTYSSQITEQAGRGLALILTPPVAVIALGRITPGCAGLYTPKHKQAWARIVKSVHAKGALLAVQLSHAGRRGATMPRSLGLDRPLPGGWPLFAPSAIPYTPNSHKPAAMTPAEMTAVCEAFVSAAISADKAGADLLVINCGHGYLLGSFLSPLTNHRVDKFGGSLQKRLRFPLEVFESVRQEFPASKPIGVSINASDWAKGGLTIDESVEIARAFKSYGCDLILPLAGQTIPDDNPDYSPDFLASCAERIRHEAGIATMVTGGVTSTNAANSILAGGRAEFCIMDLPYD